jgi:hypothetical protein
MYIVHVVTHVRDRKRFGVLSSLFENLWDHTYSSHRWFNSLTPEAVTAESIFP